MLLLSTYPYQGDTNLHASVTHLSMDRHGLTSKSDLFYILTMGAHDFLNLIFHFFEIMVRQFGFQQLIKHFISEYNPKGRINKG